MRADGKSLREIANAIETEMAIVKGWEGEAYPRIIMHVGPTESGLQTAPCAGDQCRALIRFFIPSRRRMPMFTENQRSRNAMILASICSRP